MPTGHGLRAPNSLCCGSCFPGPHRQPVLPNPPPVVLLGPAPVRCLLLYAAGVSLDQVGARELWPLPLGQWAHGTGLPDKAWGTGRSPVTPCRSGENRIMMTKVYIFLIFMVLILPSLGLTRYTRHLLL